MTSHIIILALFLIYVASICTIFGSINLWAEKKGAGKIKQAVLDWGYKYSIYWTNFVGLWLSGTLQCSPLVVVSPWYLLGGIGMPICYTIPYKLKYDNKIKIFNKVFYINDNAFYFVRNGYGIGVFNVFVAFGISEILWGFVYGCLMLAAVIGG